MGQLHVGCYVGLAECRAVKSVQQSFNWHLLLFPPPPPPPANSITLFTNLWKLAKLFLNLWCASNSISMMINIFISCICYFPAVGKVKYLINLWEVLSDNVHCTCTMYQLLQNVHCMTFTCSFTTTQEPWKLLFLSLDNNN